METEDSQLTEDTRNNTLLKDEELRYESIIRLSQTTCYDLMENNSMIVVIDVNLKPSQALNALLDVGTRACMLYDKIRKEYVGMFTVTDFLLMLLKYYDGKCNAKDIEKTSIQAWRRSEVGLIKPYMSYISPNDTLIQAIRYLCSEKLHRLPIMDMNNCNPLGIVSHKKILSFLYEKLNNEVPSFFQLPISELQIGTFDNVKTITYDTLVMDAVRFFVELRISALPVVDNDGKVVNIYSKADIINLALDRSYISLSFTIADAISTRPIKSSMLIVCFLSDTLHNVLYKLVGKTTPRVLVVDNQEKILGIVSLSDISRFIVRQVDAHSST